MNINTRTLLFCIHNHIVWNSNTIRYKVQQQPNPATSIPQHKVNTNHYDQVRTILIINAIMVTYTKQK